MKWKKHHHLPPLSKVGECFHHELRNVAIPFTPLLPGHPHALRVEVRVHEGSTSDEVIFYVIGDLLREGDFGEAWLDLVRLIIIIIIIFKAESDVKWGGKTK